MARPLLVAERGDQKGAGERQGRILRVPSDPLDRLGGREFLLERHTQGNKWDAESNV